jgi:hypothetical protein
MKSISESVVLSGEEKRRKSKRSSRVWPSSAVSKVGG